MPRKKTSSTSTSSAAAAPALSKVTSIESKSAAPLSHPNGDAVHSVEERIRQRAYDLYEQRGRYDGAADQDWLRAEAELRSAPGKRSA